MTFLGSLGLKKMPSTQHRSRPNSARRQLITSTIHAMPLADLTGVPVCEVQFQSFHRPMGFPPPIAGAAFMVLISPGASIDQATAAPAGQAVDSLRTVVSGAAVTVPEAPIRFGVTRRTGV